MTSLLYVFDAYCGWCYGFSATIEEVAGDTDIDVTVLPGSLFTGDRSGPLSAYPHIPEANTRIAEATGVRFGDAYQSVLADGSLRMNSDDAAVGYTALRTVLGAGRDAELAGAMQRAFYLDGLSLSDPQTYRRIAVGLEANPDTVEAAFADPEVRENARQLQQQAQHLGVNSYPTLLVDTPRGREQVGSPLDTADALRAQIRSAQSES